MKVCIILGTRPEIIKMSPVIKELMKSRHEVITIHSNQHYSENMDKIFFNELGLKEPDFNLNIGSGKHSNQIGNILIKLEPILNELKPDYTLVQGDTNTVFAGALASSKLGIKIGHIEAGLRSYDKTMPEESNRILTDHSSDFLFAVTETQEKILKKEGISNNKVFVVGNTITDATFNNILIAEKKSTILKSLNLSKKDFFLFTSHRGANVDDKKSLEKVLKIVEEASQHQQVVWPIHPRTLKNIKLFNLVIPTNVLTIEPVGYFDFLILEKYSTLNITDSGGVQEESCILNTPCITIRENTERPETIELSANTLVGLDYEKFKKELSNVLEVRPSGWINPYGDGTTAEKIIQVLENDYINSNPLMKKTINVIGMGYMGLPMACLLAKAGFSVTGVDINEKKISLLKDNKLPFEESGLQAIYDSAVANNIKFGTTPNSANIHIISVPTPIKNKSCDLSYVHAAAESLYPILKKKDLIIIESTIKPKATIQLKEKIKKDTGIDVLLAHCPERAIPGSTIQELIHNDRIIGGTCEQSTSIALSIYQTFSKGELLPSDSTTAECCKLMENTYRDINIALANEFDDLLTEYGVKSEQAIKLANRHPRVNILSPGPGVGGHCIAVDPYFLIEDSERETSVIRSAREINNHRPYSQTEKLTRILKSKNHNKIGVLGVAYKEGVDDTRETPAKQIIENLENHNFEIKVADPYVKRFFKTIHPLEEVIAWADILVVITNHKEFNELNYERCEVIYLKDNSSLLPYFEKLEGNTSSLLNQVSVSQENIN